MLADEYTAAFPDGTLSHVTTWDSPKV